MYVQDTYKKMKRFSILLLIMLLAGFVSAQIKISNGKLCEGEEITFTHDLQNHYDTFLWDLGDGTTFTTHDATHTFSAAGTYTVTLKASVGGTEEKNITETIVINALPKVDFNIDTTAQQSSRIFSISESETALKYDWEFGDGATQATDEKTATHTYSAPGSYVVLLTSTDNAGCTDTISHSTKINSTTKVPNVFTPNGDGQNDFFMITADEGSTLKLEIFNRWGYKIFSRSGSENIVWDGYNPQGTLVSPGTYFYVITVEEGSTSYDPLNGYITVFY